MPTVKNIKGTGDLDCKCGSWKAHWEIYTGKKAKKCSVLKCDKPIDIIGGHVRKVGSNKKHYIIPLCRDHNNLHSDKIMEVGMFVEFISANVQKTCAKK